MVHETIAMKQIDMGAGKNIYMKFKMKKSHAELTIRKLGDLSRQDSKNPVPS